MKVIAEIAVESDDPRALFFAALGAAGARGSNARDYMLAREASGDPSAHDTRTLLSCWDLAPGMRLRVLSARSATRVMID